MLSEEVRDEAEEEISVIDDDAVRSSPTRVDASRLGYLLYSSLFRLLKGGQGVIVPGCVACKKLLYTTNQYLSHLALDVLPSILEKFREK